jgi:ligand-binding sensor domain-containing protein/two-component sensor histidine kinase
VKDKKCFQVKTACIRVKYLLVITSLLLSNLLAAQVKTLAVKLITSENGLSDNQVNCVLRDKQGFIWIGTKDGLNRYDGREFYIFKNNINDSNSIVSNNISCLAYDNDSILWIGTATSGFCSFDFRTKKFTTYNKNNLPLLSNSINAITYDKTKNLLWLALYNSGLQQFDLKTKKIKSEFIVTPNNTYYDVTLKDSKAYMGGIMESLKTIETVGKNRTVVSDTAHTINKIFVGSDNTIWCGAWDNALHEFNDNAVRIKSYVFDGTNKINWSGDEIISIAEDDQKILWCGTKISGIQFFDLKTKSFLKRYAFSKSISSCINCLYQDNCKRIWIGTETGLFVYDPLQNQFEVVKLPVPENASSCKVYDRLITKSGREFIVTGCGLFYKTIFETKYTFKDIIYKNEKQQLTSIFMDHKNRIFIGSNKTVFLVDTISMVLNTVENNIKKDETHFFSILSSRVNSIIELPLNGDTILAASFYGQYIGLIHPKKKNIFILLSDYEKNKNGYENLTRKLFVDSKNNFWVCGSLMGISQINIPPTIVFDHFTFADTAVKIILATSKNWANIKSGKINEVNNVYDIVENKDNSFWLSTQSTGLVKFYPENKELPFISFNENYTSLQGMAKTPDENIWIISSTGLLNYNTKDNIYKRFDKKDGIPEGLSGYFFQTNSSTLAAGFDGGFLYFDPSNILKDIEKPLAQITQMWVMDVASDSLLLSPIKLNNKSNFLKFYISANCFTDSEETTFMYFLEGIDKTWRSNQNNPLITYTNLPAGNFNLKVKAINSDGFESKIISLPLIITPPFYNTFYFYIAMLTLLFGVVYFLYRYRISQILKLQEVRNKIARDLHDDIGSTIGSIHLYSQIANAKLKEDRVKEIKSILEKIGSSSREIIDKTGDAVWAVKASNDTLKNLILRMESYAANLLGESSIQFNFEIDESIENYKFEMVERKNIFLIFKEAIHNIIKYSNCSMVNITVKKITGKINITIADNGKGFSTNHINTYNGNGIKNMHDRAIEIKGSFQIKSQPEKGTCISVTI